jgi:urease accessory protein UreE
MRVSAPTGAVLLRLVYHLANRHVRAMLASDAVYIEPDAVLAQMVQQLGGQVSTVQMAFEPEPGAYHGGHHHGEASSHDADMGRIGEMLSIAAHKGRDHG